MLLLASRTILTKSVHPLLSVRDDIRQSPGHRVVSVLGSQAARDLALSDALVGGHHRTESGLARTMRAYRSFSRDASRGCDRGVLGPS
jgi:hypothetical protein